MFQPILPVDLEPPIAANILPRLIAALGTELGEYEPGLPAAYLVRNPDTEPPKSLQTSGIELLVFMPKPQSAIVLNSNTALPTFWEIRLINYDRSRSLLQSYQNILDRYPDCYLSSHIQANRDLAEQLNLSLSHVEIIR